MCNDTIFYTYPRYHVKIEFVSRLYLPQVISPFKLLNIKFYALEVESNSGDPQLQVGKIYLNIRVKTFANLANSMAIPLSNFLKTAMTRFAFNPCTAEIFYENLEDQRVFFNLK